MTSMRLEEAQKFAPALAQADNWQQLLPLVLGYKALCAVFYKLANY